MSTIFVAHSSDAKAIAVKFKDILMRGEANLKVFLSSDWNSIEAGTIWLEEIEKALASHTHFIALITRAEDSELPWICYEVGFARGRRVLPKIFVFGGIALNEIAFPLAGIQFVGTWDTNRWKMELNAMGVKNLDDEKSRDLANLFRQDGIKQISNAH